MRITLMLYENLDKYFLASIVESSRDSIISINFEGIITSWNKAAESLYGYPATEAVGKPLTMLTLPEDLQEIHDKFDKIKHSQRIETFETERIGKDGDHIVLEITLSPVKNAEGEVIGVSTIAREMPNAANRFERQQEKETIRRSDANLASAQRIAHIGSWEWDIQNNELSWSDEIYRIYGFTKNQFKDPYETFFNTIHTDDRKMVQSARRAALSQIVPYNIEYRIIRLDGEERFVCERGEAVFDESESPLQLIGTLQDITERKRVEESLHQTEAKYRTLIESSLAIVYLAAPHPPYSPIYISPNISRFGYTIEEWFDCPDMWVSLIHKEDRERVLHATENAIEKGIETDLEYRIVSRDGTIYWLHDKGRFVKDEKGNKTGWQGVMLDITKTKELEEQLRQSQKLESIGLLAGGIAHDFNNMLTAINGYSDLTLRKLKDDDPLRRNIEEIKKAGERSAFLTHQLLAFSRQQFLHPVVLNLNEVINDTVKMLQRLIGEDIELNMALNHQVGRVKVDPGQLSQIIMNLAVNARDAMPQGGKLTMETANIFLDPDYSRRHIGVLPGAYVLLAVSDTGCGISDDVKKRIFEPFFTTKEIGRGTGLGLATVYGIVKQSGGNINVYSEEGIGTTFKVYLPRVVEQVQDEKIEETSTELPKGTETILLVEDEELVRNLARQILEYCGYTVIEARDGSEAVKLVEEGANKFDLLMTDVVMPQMGGRELAENLKDKLSNLLVLFTSGYTTDAIVRHGVIETNTNFIQKPFTPEALANKIRQILDTSYNL